MRCLQCDYPLAGVAARRCPECGRAFDPADPATFDAPGRTRPLTLLHAALIACTAPLVIAMLIQGACWLLAAAQLGHLPRIHFDDPAGIPVVRTLRKVWLVMLPLALPFIPAALILAPALAWLIPAAPRARRRSRRIAAACVIAIALSLAAHFLMRPYLVTSWLLD